jgi:hypothetical protein
MPSDDLVVLVPSRGRPGNVARLVEACMRTCRAHTRLHFAFDICDPHVRANLDAADWPDALATTGPRDTLTGWTNKLAMRHLADAPAMASIGDDHVPITDGWDEQLLEALPEHGGYSYPNDLRRDDIPEAVVISTSIVAELGWFCYPQVTHWYNDNIWRDIGTGAGCLVYCRDVIVRHDHPNVTGKPGDQTYADAAESLSADLGAYQRWRLRWMRQHVDAVRGVRRQAAIAVGHAGSHGVPVQDGAALAGRRDDPGAGGPPG